MKDGKTITIKEIMEHHCTNQNDVTRFETTFDRCVKLIGCTKVDWRSFNVYKDSLSYIIDMIVGCKPGYLLAVCDLIKSQRAAKKTIKIVVIKGKETEVSSVGYNGDTKLVCIHLSKEDENIISEAAKED